MKKSITILLVVFLTFTLVQSTANAYIPASAKNMTITDDFGYTFAEAAVNWVSGDSALGPAGNTSYGPVDIGFNFKYYGRAYSSVYISGNGMISFNNDPNINTPIDTYLPKTIFPNNLIAPFWVALKNGTVKYGTGGTTPDRYFVVEYYNVVKLNGDSGFNKAWFEVILYENNNIAWTYFTLPDVKNCHAGIEDETGSYGLSYDCNILHTTDLGEFLISYPDPAARVKLTPPVQSSFGSPGATVSFPVTVLNAGDLGSDRFDLTATSPWTVTLYQSDGTTLLTDTDSSGKVDTGSLAQNTSTNIIAKVAVPGGASVGNNAQVILEARSKLNNAIQKTATLQVAVPASFAQVYINDTDKAMRLERIEPGLQANQKISADGEDGYSQAVAETPNGNLVYAWTAGRNLANNQYVTEIKYTIRDRNGGLVKDITKLTDYSSATTYVTDSDITIAVTPDHHIGLLWKLEYFNYSTFVYNPNIYFAVLNADGTVAYPPTNITGFSTWYSWNSNNSVKIYTPAITATSDNRFVLAWLKHTFINFTQNLNDIYLASRQSSGASVTAMTQYTHDTNSQSDGYLSPSLSPLAQSGSPSPSQAKMANGRALLTWSDVGDGDIHYAVLDSTLAEVKASTNLSGDGSGIRDTDSHAVQVLNGNIIAAWLAQGDIKYAVINSSYNRVGSPYTLANPMEKNGNTGISLTSDTSNHVIATWMDYDASLYYVPYRPHIYYALLNSDGSVATPAMFMHSSLYNLETSFIGYGNTSHASTNPDVFLQQPDVMGGLADGLTILPILVGNQGAVSASGVTLIAVLDASLTYISANPAPNSTNGGHNLTWNLPNLGGGTNTRVTLVVHLPDSVPVGTRYPITLSAACAESDANPGNNAATVEIMVSRQVYLPLVRK